MISQLKKRAQWTPRYQISASGTLSIVESAGADDRTVQLSRGLCSFTSMPLPAGNRSDLVVKAAILAHRSKAPYEEPGLFAVEKSQSLLIWVWDAKFVAGVIAASPLNGKTVTIVPESALFEGADGVRLVQGLDGVEAQLWHESTLKASQWWPSVPDLPSLSLFLRGAGAALQDAPLEAVEPQLLRSIPRDASQSSDGQLRSFGVLAAGIVAALAVGWMMFSVGQVLRLSQEIESAQGLATDPALRTGAAARSAAVADAARLRSISQFNALVDPVVVLSEIQPILARGGIVISSWESREGQATFDIQVPPALELEGFVKELNTTTSLDDVSVSPSNAAGLLTVRAVMKSLALAAMAAPGAQP